MTHEQFNPIYNNILFKINCKYKFLGFLKWKCVFCHLKYSLMEMKRVRYWH